MRKYLLIIGLCTAMTACNEEGQPSTGITTEPDNQFLMVASDEALYQINAGQVAAANAGVNAIRNYGEEMTKAHTDVSQALQKLAGEKQVTIRTTLSDERQQQLDSLAMRNGASLDSLYLQQMIASHNRAVHALEVESTSGNDAEIKAWATDRLPDARQFAERAMAIRDSLNQQK